MAVDGMAVDGIGVDGCAVWLRFLPTAGCGDGASPVVTVGVGARLGGGGLEVTPALATGPVLVARGLADWLG